MSTSRRYDCSFFTATILEWKQLLSNDDYKQIILDSLLFLVKNDRIYVHGFVIMSNHLHLLWHVRHPYKLENVQPDFLRYTAQMILKDLRTNNRNLIDEFRVSAKDRQYQIWERNSLTVEIWNEEVLEQKLRYIHENPVKAGLCNYMEDYKFSSSKFYNSGEHDFGFL